ncbi:circularly permuted type 2 ATP-grasp protein [uncultured Piscinibacter sp.]|uniref:circularly permuted type 2 ATP-grasp protein n=1 Tax=uncultured Piscinibacter sp. TaxID=1131835 RepID=UPI002627D4AA|nr:circularly permuted type 2 ATP-grasp protein [uncultured Piscinibacter sp.]
MLLKSLLAGYAARSGRYDELLAAPHQPRPHWGPFLHALAARGAGSLSDTLTLIEREVRENGITYNVYADPQGMDRPWAVDPLPLLLSAPEWQAIEEGVTQRAELLNRVLADLYGEQELLRRGTVPPAVVFGHAGYLSPAQGIRPSGGVHLFHYAADLARSPDGRWWVVGDRTQAPSGAGYALENRLVVSRVFPQMFRELRVQHLASFFAALKDSLLRWAPRGGPGDGVPLIALLTPGPYNETYFEHALLARYLGVALVEGSDLTVREGCVWMKTVEGLQRVHALLRRQDDDYCDPLELRSDSALGVAGLTECARRGTVLLANSLGSGVLESGALLGYLPALCEQLLGEPLKLPSVATWWLGEPAAFEDAWKRLDQVLIKPIERSSREPSVFGADLDAAARARLKARVAVRPQRYVAQEWVHVSQAPVLERSAHGRETLAARTVGLRVFAVATPDGYRLMPGGLTRVAGDEEPRVVAMQRGGRSKDTWVLSDAPVNASFSLLTSTVTPAELVSSRANLPSRTAENLFWFGRYGERADTAVRLLRVAIEAQLDDTEVDGGSAALALCERLGLIDADDEPAIALLRAATHPDGALAERLRQVSRVAFTLRDRMSADHWRTINQLIGDPVFQRNASSTAMRLPLALAWLDRAVTAMVTLSGFVLDGMTRGTGWRFLSMGRRIERLWNLATALQVATREGRDQGLQWLLEWADSAVTYRSRYLVQPEWLPVLDLLVRDELVPRSLAFQLKGLAEYVAKLETVHGRFASDVVAPGQAALAALTPAELHPESEALAELLDQLQRIAGGVSDELTLKFFSHAASRSVLSLVA